MTTGFCSDRRTGPNKEVSPCRVPSISSMSANSMDMAAHKQLGWTPPNCSEELGAAPA